ncbi:MAG: glycoside hydrolase, partial [Acidobacteria bacterium]
RRTGEAYQIAPRRGRGADYRTIRTQPVLFSPIDPHTLYFASNTLWKTTTGGNGWTQISPDLTRKTWDVPPNVGIFKDTPAAKPTQRGVIYTVAPSPLDINRLWVGTDDGLIHVTGDGGKSWKDVTPPDLRPWAKVSIVDASHSDPLGAYAAINTFRLDDLRPHIYRTHNGGKTWTLITNGIPDGATVNTVREDSKRKGLLFAGSETQVYVSFDDGDHWQSLRLNMPATSIRDLAIKDDDLVAGTHGRGFWILDGIAPLRQVKPQTLEADAFLFKPAAAVRFQWNKNTDTPLPPDEPSAPNPPDGAIVDYYLKSAATGVVMLEIVDAAGKTVRRYASDEQAPPVKDVGNVPAYWIRPMKTLSADAGLHRFVWDLHYPPPPGDKEYPIAATPHDTAPEPKGPWVLPGTYTVKLTANGRSYTQPLTVRMDPRVKTGVLGLQQQFALSKRLYDALVRIDERLRGGPPDPAMSRLSREIAAIYGTIQEAPVAPPVQTAAAARDVLNRYDGSTRSRERLD